MMEGQSLLLHNSHLWTTEGTTKKGKGDTFAQTLQLYMVKVREGREASTDSSSVALCVLEAKETGFSKRRNGGEKGGGKRTVEFFILL